MIKVSHLTKKYGDRAAIDDVSFSVNKGEILGFLGPNGAGKTTTMKIITGCLAPTEGSVLIDNEDIFSQDSVKIRAKMGYLPETPPLYMDMYVENYLKYVGSIKRCHPKKIPSLVVKAMKKAGLMDVRSRLISNLSKGYRQRVGLAQALVSEPPILILDEPTVGLDPVQMVEIRNLIHDLKKDHTVILSTHILSTVEATCKKVVIINKGKVVTQGLLSEMKQKMSNRVLKIRVRRPSTQLEKKIQGLKGVSQVKNLRDRYEVSINSDIEEDVAQVVVSAGLLEMYGEALKLEDIFIQVTK